MSEHRDFEVIQTGSVCLLQPLTKLASNWVDKNIGADNGYQPYYPTVIVEPRYLGDIMEGIKTDGLQLA